MGKHTPGPWAVDDCRHLNGAYWITANHPEWGACSHAEVRHGCDEGAELGSVEANAHLIAAAPALLEALEWALGEIDAIEEVDGQIVDPDGYSVARAAIAKATGEEK